MAGETEGDSGVRASGEAAEDERKMSTFPLLIFVKVCFFFLNFKIGQTMSFNF